MLVKLVKLVNLVKLIKFSYLSCWGYLVSLLVKSVE